MITDQTVDSIPGHKKRKTKNSQLRVVFDTNALYVTPTSVGSASDLVRPEIENLIRDSRYPDLDIHWYLPEVVRHERQYQMQTEALKLRSHINKIERLLAHNLGLTDQGLLDHVRTRIEAKMAELGLQEIGLDHAVVDWQTVIRAAEYRKPPFQAGETEKGFRDALIAEIFLQLLDKSPKTPALCRVVLVTSDALLTEAVKGRISNSQNASTLAGIDELKGLINTLVSNVGEDFIAQLKPKADRLFFVSADDKDVLFYKENVRQKLEEKFGIELKQRPEGTTFRSNGKWLIAHPNFSRKEGRKIFWTSRIEVEVDAGVTTNIAKAPVLQTSGALVSPTSYAFQAPNAMALKPTQALSWLQPVTDADLYSGSVNIAYPNFAYAPQERIITHKGSQVFEVLWSAEVTMSKDLKKSAIEQINHISLTWQPISQQ
jgi:hypothetical protein